MALYVSCDEMSLGQTEVFKLIQQFYKQRVDVFSKIFSDFGMANSLVDFDAMCLDEEEQERPCYVLTLSELDRANHQYFLESSELRDFLIYVALFKSLGGDTLPGSCSKVFNQLSAMDVNKEKVLQNLLVHCSYFSMELDDNVQKNMLNLLSHYVGVFAEQIALKIAYIHNPSV